MNPSHPPIGTPPIGTPGVPWGAPERELWRSRQTVKRSYPAEVVSVIDSLRSRYDVLQYGQLSHDPPAFPLLALKSRGWDDSLPCMLVTGGVHGYETSGVHGALRMLSLHVDRYRGRANILAAPCVSPWAYETVQRWNRDAIDPNRSFRTDSPAEESAALIRLTAPLRSRVLVHVDLHETTDSDESEFRPALAARDGVEFVPGEIPDGFYLVGDSDNPQLEFQKAVLAAAGAVTRIAPADRDGRLIGTPLAAPGIINYPFTELGLCPSITPAPYKTTTEVYPDGPHITPEECIAAQVAAAAAAMDYALARGRP